MSPDRAAARESKVISPTAIISLIEQRSQQTDVLVVEGVGGVMVPLSKDQTVLDVMQVIRPITVVVTGGYLGTISHTLTTCSVIENRGLSVDLLAISQGPETNLPLPMSLDETASTLSTHLSAQTKILCLPTAHGLEPWKMLPPIASLLLD